MENNQESRPTQAAIAQRNQVIYEALAQLRDTGRPDYSVLGVDNANFDQHHLARLQEILRSLEVDYEALSYIYDEGAVEITVRSRGRKLKLEIGGDPASQIVEQLRSVVEARLRDVANRIFYARQDMANPEEPEAFQRNQARQVSYRELLLTPGESLSLGGELPATEQAA